MSTHALICALIYTRVSTDEQATSGLSLPAQLQECRRYVTYHANWVIGDEYSDVMSGKRDASTAIRRCWRKRRGFGPRGAGP